MSHEGVLPLTSRHVDGPVRSPIIFSICTLVSDLQQYGSMCESFRSGGFDGPDIEFLYIDNTSGNTFEAGEGLNCMMSQAQGTYLILCHQDVSLIEDGRDVLAARLKELEALDERWALAGNAGVQGARTSAMRFTDRTGTEHNTHDFPFRVNSLDENFIVVKGASRLGFSRDLSGFHLYGADICLQAEVRGWNAYVIDFHLRHVGEGLMGEPFIRCRIALEEKYGKFLISRRIGTTCATVNLTGHDWLRKSMRLRQNFSWYRRLVWKRMRGKPAPPRE